MKLVIGRVPFASEISTKLSATLWAEMLANEKFLFDLLPAIYRHQKMSKSTTIENSTTSKDLNSFPSNITIHKSWVPIPSKLVTYHARGSDQDFLINSMSMKMKKIKEQKGNEEEAIVLLHGYASGISKWTPLLAQLAESGKNIYAFDWLGWGLSSRPDFRTLMTEHENPDQVAGIWCRSFKVWYDQVGLQKYKNITLVSHSMGSYLALMLLKEDYSSSSSSSNSRRIYQNISRLVCLSPVGISTQSYSPSSKPASAEEPERFIPVSQLASYIPSFSPKDLGQSLLLQIFWTNSPHAVLSMIPPEQAKNLLRFLNPSSHLGYPGLLGERENQASIDYTFSVSIAPSSGDAAFRNLAQWQGNRIVWARPLGTWLQRSEIPIDLVYGEYDWTDMAFAWNNLRQAKGCRLLVMDDVGHHVYSVKPDKVASIINNPNSKEFAMNEEKVARWKGHREKSASSDNAAKAIKNTFLSWFA